MPSRSFTAIRSWPWCPQKRIITTQATSLKPFAYTGGRWLKDEQQQLSARTRTFDYDALCQRAIRACPGAGSIVKTEKKEGGFNRVFLLEMDNACRVAARIPYRFSGPSGLATHSEVATMAYVRQHSDVPVPKVLDWCDNDRSIGTEYILLSHAPGVQLHQRWQTMNSSQHAQCVKGLSKLATDVARLEFPAYGSIYFADALAPELPRIELGDGFCLGPHCGYPLWPCYPKEVDKFWGRFSNTGPGHDLQSYCSLLIDVGLARLPSDDVDVNKPDWWGTAGEHRSLLATARQVLHQLSLSPQLQEISQPMLFHPDLHKRNVFVDDHDLTRVTALIDWQSACIQPTFVFADHEPDFVAIPEAPSALDNDLAKSDDWNRIKKDAELCHRVFEVSIRGCTPRLNQARASEVSLLAVLAASTSSWKNSIVPLRQALIDVSSQWSKLGLQGQCTYQPSDEAIKAHKAGLEQCEAAEELKSHVMIATGSDPDGWVHLDDWKEAQEMNLDMYRLWLQANEGEDTRQVKLMYPFDV